MLYKLLVLYYTHYKVQKHVSWLWLSQVLQSLTVVHSYHKLSLLVHHQVAILMIWQEKIPALSSPSVDSHEFVNQKSTPSLLRNTLNS